MATIPKEKLKQDVKAIIKTGDLSTLSAKKIRLQLQEKYDTDLTDRKKELEEIIYEAFQARQNNENDSAESGDEAMEEAKNGDSQSDSESDFDEPEDHKPSAPKKKPKKAQEMNDEELAKQLQQAENSTGRRTRNQSKPVRRKPKAKSSGGGEGGTKKRSGYSQLCALSEELAALMETNEMARSDVIKKMWEIVRERDLLDPKNKQFMICDDELFKLFGRKRVRTFGMMKYLAKHIFKK